MFCFNSLQTGKHIQRKRRKRRKPLPLSFNSLQTGKHIQSRCPVMSQCRIHVSIPFKRETISKVIEESVETINTLRKFQFPSNGKAYPKQSEPSSTNSPSTMLGFNSLQTGKHIQRYREREMDEKLDTIVSIPFKRESISKVAAAAEPGLNRLFQFPSNGKAYPKTAISVSR